MQENVVQQTAACSESAEARPKGVFRTVVAPLVLLLVTPPTVIVLWITCRYLDGSLLRLTGRGGITTVARHLPRPSMTAVMIVLGFALFELLLLRVLPGETIEGPPSPAGHRPRYKRNGSLAWAVTHATFLAASWIGWISPVAVYDRFGEILVTVCASTFVFCWFLYFKGVYAPSTPDAGTSGNPVFDYFQGVELHPSLFGVNLKQLFNCRIGMMGWSLIVLSFAASQIAETGRLSSSMFVCVALQAVYILVFFSWEDGYFTTIDVTHDRFGYYICWGVLTWIPGVYTIAAQYLVKHPRELGAPLTLTLLAIGLGSIGVNHAVDVQRQRVRRADGATAVWGKPAQFIRAEYRTEDGLAHENLLLVSGFWSLSRHFHYVPEVVVALAWTLSVGEAALLPYLYPLFLTILLVDRADRVDLRCQKKYGASWTEYCQRVPRKIVPWIY